MISKRTSVLSPIFEAEFSESSYGSDRGGTPIKRQAASSISPKAAELWWTWIGEILRPVNHDLLISMLSRRSTTVEYIASSAGISKRG